MKNRTIADWRIEINERLPELNYVERNLKEEKKALVAAEDNLTDAKEAQILIQQVAQGIQEHAHAKIAGVVTSCLAAVFDDPYKFTIEFERKRGRTEAKLFFKRGKQQVDPMAATGGGAVDVAAFALRTACLILARPQLRKVLILDEPFRFVSAGYRDRVRALMENLSKDLGIQFILVTHCEELVCGNIIRI